MFFSPIPSPVTVYKSSDPNAPILDRTPNCVAVILKACLVTGYGKKSGAGWSMPFENEQDGIKVFRPKVGAEFDYFVKVANDTGREVNISIHGQMTDIDNGNKLMELATPFKYGIQNATGQNWLLVASDRSFVFFYQTANHIQTDKSGTFLICGDTGKNTVGQRGVYLHHTGGSWESYWADRYKMINNGNDGGNLASGLYLPFYDKLVTPSFYYLFDGNKNLTVHDLSAPLLVQAEGDIYPLPFVWLPSNTNAVNGQEIRHEAHKFIAHYTATYELSCIFVPTDTWIY